MAITKYKTDSGNWIRAEIRPVEVERETEQCVWVKRDGGSRGEVIDRRAKVTDFEVYHDSWEAAHSFLLEQADKKVKAARRSLEMANSLFGNVKGMKKPAGDQA
jgi:hypothetical protein